MVTLLGRVCKHVSSSWTDTLSKPYVAPWLTIVRHFSFTDDQSGSIKQHVGESDDFILQQSDPNLNHNGSTTSQDGYNIEPIPSRSLKGRKPINQPSPHFREYSRGSHSFHPRIDDNHGRHGEVDKANKSSKIDLGFQGRNITEINRGADQSGDSFLEKFKLGFDKKTVNPSDVPESRHSEEAKSSDPNQPAPESMP
ncbi:hypothetical protein RIF29_28780 [Crotalaria pallida]|uniref:Uncharacterized protein n=1 Tax=Crotalaria pallida TaxID=3830 RepID=A0AAN9HZQ0_CROPI